MMMKFSIQIIKTQNTNAVIDYLIAIRKMFLLNAEAVVVTSNNH